MPDSIAENATTVLLPGNPLASILLFTLLLAPTTWAGEIPSGSILHAKLDHWVSTQWVEPDDPLRFTIASPVWHENRIVLSAGTALTGRVAWKKKVGWGWRREKASLMVEVNELSLPGGVNIPITANLLEIENAREKVDDSGVIRGVRATTSPAMRITSQVKHLPSLNLYPHPVLLIYKMVMPFFPEPEIVFPPGAEFRVRLDKPVYVPEEAVLPDQIREFSPVEQCEITSLTHSLPTRVKYKGRENGIVNLLLIGAEADIVESFAAAGWLGADPMSKKAFVKQVYAALEVRSYKRQPMWPIEYQERPPDLMLQKSLNDFRQRDHVRFWRLAQQWRGQDVWAGAASRDIAVNIDFKKRKLLHRIESNIDLEREQVVYDLALTGCAAEFHWVDRPDLQGSTLNVNGDVMRTDGGVAVVRVGECSSGMRAALETKNRPKRPPPAKRYLSRQLLVVRHDLIRSNIIYTGISGTRMLVRSLRGKNVNVELTNSLTDQAVRPSNTPQRRVTAMSCPLPPSFQFARACRDPRLPGAPPRFTRAACHLPAVGEEWALARSIQ